ncbi:MAG TPA: hypothetical protein VLV88_05285 [Terriglobales bacterium]|nr:hypothetical protein [Terriglobales bacterium]
MTDRDQFHAQIEKLTASHALHGSESLCKLLRYLAKQALEHPGVAVKEYQIATEVFARQTDFDPQLDSMVRVQAGRLRSKLSEYYNTEGANDAVVVELPKGSYAVAFHVRPHPAPGNGVTEEQWHHTAEGRKPTRWVIASVVLAVLLAGSLASLTVLLLTRRVAPLVTPSASESVPPPILTFWNGFVTGPDEPWVIFSNAAFVGRPDTGMRYYVAARDKNAFILDHYTGVGEVLAVHNLDRVFRMLHRTLRVKRGSLFSLDDAKNNDLIFIGSPSENLTLLEIPSTQEFVFRSVKSGQREGNVEIINVHPEGDEPKEFLATPSNVPVTEDYAVVAYTRGINPDHSELILAGTTTLGTQAAAEFVTNENYLAVLLKRLNVDKPSELKPFESVIRVKVAKGVPVESQLVALRKLKS